MSLLIFMKCTNIYAPDCVLRMYHAYLFAEIHSILETQNQTELQKLSDVDKVGRW